MTEENCIFISNKMRLQNTKIKWKNVSGGIEMSTNLTDFSRLLTRFVFGNKTLWYAAFSLTALPKAVSGYISAQ